MRRPSRHAARSHGLVSPLRRARCPVPSEPHPGRQRSARRRPGPQRCRFQPRRRLNALSPRRHPRALGRGSASPGCASGRAAHGRATPILAVTGPPPPGRGGPLSGRQHRPHGRRQLPRPFRKPSSRCTPPATCAKSGGDRLVQQHSSTPTPKTWAMENFPPMTADAGAARPYTLSIGGNDHALRQAAGALDASAARRCSALMRWASWSWSSRMMMRQAASMGVPWSTSSRARAAMRS